MVFFCLRRWGGLLALALAFALVLCARCWSVCFAFALASAHC
ncbi:hypothetical protein K788_0008168 [Paraburkholderia caribensis MBA4]|uniref:Uncharacterized protein n=1 Tax=Paraburkholderia caribensis MBA4 TaxID=1323664 RepID=A0A0P0R945_9BURK|nr:hypothetical protein K788_0008168 [Paraburkholderia caribensis MBA4]